ncbi:MAG: hypothetical protein SOX69_07575 [Oscillospiraceae bacterium]|nr:hypothetical protein [Oscillospiraceae bacterium]
MKHKKIIAFATALTLVLGFSACKRGKNGDETTVRESTAVEESTTSEETTAETTTETESTTEPEKKFVFNDGKARVIGEMSSEIYGKMKLYFQDGKIAIKDEFGDLKFVLDAEGYSPSAEEDGIQLTAEDMNFDGYTDFRLPSSLGSVNSFYYCWLWDMSAKTFKYYPPLSAICSPVFNKNTKEIVSTNRSSAARYDVTTYKWIDGQLSVQKHELVTADENITSTGAEIAENNTVEISNGMFIGFITLYGNPGSQCRWIPIVEDEGIVDVLSQTYDDATAKTMICFQAHGVGTTTAVVRFALDRNSDYISERVFNITADDDLHIKITEIE